MSRSLLNNINMLLDGLKWLPLSTEQDYQMVWQQIEQEIFDEEMRQLMG
ncbi:hypothetical protein P4S72_00430 [Vibrio sp. PP-XX7]